MKPVILLVTAPNDEAEAVSRAVLQPFLGACVNIISKMRAMFWWEGEIQDELESASNQNFRRQV